MRLAFVALLLLAACSRVPEEPGPVLKEMRPMPGNSDPAPPPKPPSTPQKVPITGGCPKDPAPGENATLYGHGRVAFVNADGKRHDFTVEIAASEAAQERGLMFRTSLADDAAMVFTFADPHHAVFWMKNTCIALDMVFVSDTDTVIGVVTAPPLDESPREVPGFSKYVVELAAGVADKRGIAIGSKFVPPTKS
ncbi:MAG: hypothetical protein NVSMB47_07750 [Polyangiales bacterium]